MPATLYNKHWQLVFPRDGGHQDGQESSIVPLGRSCVSSITSRLHVASRTQAALYALREGIASLDEADE